MLAGVPMQHQPTPLLRSLLDAGRAKEAAGYAHALVDLASAAASLVNPTTESMNAAGFAASMQLRAVTPHAGLFVPAGLRGLTDVASTGASSLATNPTAAPLATPVPSTPAPTATLDELFAKLDALVGLAAVKDEIHHQAELLRVERLRGEHGLKTPDVNRHLVFVGNPGTGKTTVARLVAGIYRALGVLEQGQVIETDRVGLVAGYEGQTAMKTTDVVTSALGGVLFVDEAYVLASDDYGHEAINTLVKAMEDHRDDPVSEPVDTRFRMQPPTGGTVAQVEIEREGAVMVVTLNRPHRKNAMTLTMFAQLADAWEEVTANDDIRCVILTGAEGDFSSGHGPARPRRRRRRTRRHRHRRPHEGGPGLHLPRPPQDVPAHQARDRRGRGRRHRRRDRDPAGHRHPHRRRERALRCVGGALVALPDGRFRGAPAAPGAVRGRGRHPAHRQAHHRRRGDCTTDS